MFNMPIVKQVASITKSPIEVNIPSDVIPSTVCGCGNKHESYMWKGQRNYQCEGKLWLASCLLDWSFKKIKELESKIPVDTSYNWGSK
jgi:hypothetical protein